MTVAAGVFAPGHLGELTRLVPFEMVDDVLVATGRTQSRVRLLPARVVVYLLLAGCLFAELGYRQVWSKLTSGLRGLPIASPSGSALRQARQRLGPRPVRALFDLLRGPAATSARQVRWRGLLLTVIDGTTLVVADSPANTGRYTKHRCANGSSGYPQLRLSALLTCGTRSVIDAVFDPVTVGELDQARTLTRSLQPGMLLLADRNYAAADLLTTIAATGAHLLIRSKANRRLAMIARLPDGSWLSKIGALTVRVVEARISITTTAGTHTGDYRLITTLLDPHTHPAAELIRIYHERWEIETAYLELKSSILAGRVLRARTPDGIDQEIHALLIVYQLLRTAMADATDSQPGLDPDRASFTTALNTARDQIVHAAGVIAETVIDLVGVIGAQILANLLPERRLRTKTRMIKRSNSKYQARGPNIDRHSYKATTSIDIISPDP
ncbi:IS4 family transposase [Micromonospora inositola]|uniref:Transposase DDE domain-containing protein n=1 Tax=Micromonospora inositola TaxID=47865 RepID=A0A1C5K5C7_9ACTN|nr:IS4 family transposase [Micromonospora inositola]SCG44457.1 Transposase DDE domain-containing protein [Micromonospora inositola]SCG69753.1 Transposase DDE domain-containing protein [Micromonospora inositola]SCG77984.1 transposase, IS4 family [Micromonospora inositola]